MGGVKREGRNVRRVTTITINLIDQECPGRRQGCGYKTTTKQISGGKRANEETKKNKT